jgi:hypothetical protein
MVAQLTGQAKTIVLNLSSDKPEVKEFSSIKDWAVNAAPSVVNSCCSMPDFHKNIKGFTRMFTVLSVTQGTMYMCKVVHDEIDTETEELTSTLTIGTIKTSNGETIPSIVDYFNTNTEDVYTYTVTTKLDSGSFWKPASNGFYLRVGEFNSHPHVHEMLTFIKSKASQNFYIVNVYSKKTNITPRIESSNHKNLMGCILKTSFANLYAAATAMRNHQ